MRIISFLTFLLPLTCLAQKEASIWYFGAQAGLDFNDCDPIALTDGMLYQLEGCATIADTDGNLLFYTDGVSVYNAAHNVMPNGMGLWGNPSSSQSAIIVPNPIDSSLYYIFTVANNAGQYGLAYSVVDMELAAGMGDILPGEKNIQLNPLVAEKLTAVNHANNEDVWVIAHEMDSNNFITYLVTGAGVNQIPVVSGVGDEHLSIGLGTGAIGCIKASPDGTKLACAKGFMTTGLELFDFDNATGFISNPKKINDFDTYGVEFSTDSSLLYATTPAFAGKIYQYNVTLPDLEAIQESETLIAADNKYATLQLAVNGKIYAAQTDPNGSPVYNTLSVINNPNNVGEACDFQEDVVSLNGKYSQCGLPPFNQSYFQYEINSDKFCFGDISEFHYITYADYTSISWDFGDPDSSADNTANGADVTHVFSAPGTYTVTADLTTSVNCHIVLTQEITIHPRAELNQPDDLVQCGESIFDLTATIPNILGPDQDVADFDISYYINLGDAEAGVPGTEILAPEAYIPENGTQQAIYVRFANEYGCYDITTFEILVNSKAEVDLSNYDNVPICFDLDPETPVIGGNYSPIVIDTGLPEEGYIFEWKLNGNLLPEDGPEISVEVPGEYSVTVTDASSTVASCTATSTATIIGSNPPEFELSAIDFSGMVTVVNVSGSGDYEFSIDQENWIDLGENGQISFTGSTAGEYLVYGRDKNGCGMTVMEVVLIDYMKFFTPNADGVNDNWRIAGLHGQPSANLYIFDRYGKLLTSFRPSGPGWDGTYNGKPLPSTDYWFLLEYISSKGTREVYSNHFSLIR
ncbi:MAG TPA: T9SS type B sorting domain-containing protein [Flavobacterium sp.]|nr:T9SS type B sorting domain-containing protein [Flavobacterium sp.]